MIPIRNLSLPEWIYVCLALSVTILVGFEVFVFKTTLLTNGDYFEHAAALNEWLKKPFSPDNPQLVSPASSARYTPFYFPFVLIGSLFGWDHETVYGIISLTTAPLLMAMIFIFAKNMHPNPVTPVLALLIFMTVWYHPWDYSSVYEISTLFRIIGFPSINAFAVSLGVLAVLIRALKMKNPGRLRLLAIVIGTALVLATHLLTGAFLLGTAGVFILFTMGVPLRHRIMMALTIAGGVALATLWPFYNTWDVAFSHHRYGNIPWILDLKINSNWAAYYLSGHHQFYQALRLIPVWIGFLCALYIAWKHRNFVPLAGIILFAGIYALHMVVAIPLGHRFIIYAIFFGHIAIILAGLDLWQELTKQPEQTVSGFFQRKKAAFAATTIVSAALALSANRIIPHAEEITYPRRHRSHIALQMLTDENSIIAGNIPTIWSLPTYDRKILHLRHPNPLVPDQRERALANAILLSLPDPELETIAANCFGVTHIVLPHRLPNLSRRDRNKAQRRTINEIKARNLPYHDLDRYILVTLDTPPETLTCQENTADYLQTAFMEIRARKPD